MNLTDRVRSFHRRRIDIPVGSDALVLDVGSGDKPHWRADVLLDRFPEHEHKVQRSGAARARVSRPLFDADAADMPFGDKVFDFVVCSHMLEHVPDPAAVLAEITRVGTAGYIEVPHFASAKIVDFPSHLWWCSIDDGVLQFRAKTNAFFDADIDRFLDDSGLRRRMSDLLDRHLDQRVIELHWDGAVPYRVEGNVSAELLDSAAAGEFQHRSGETIAARLMTAAFTLPRSRQRRRRPAMFNAVVKPELRIEPDAELTRRIYRLT